jgi:hypothetical protein
MRSPRAVWRNLVQTWRAGRALRWLEVNNVELRRAARSDGYSTNYGWEVFHRGQFYYSGDPAHAIEYAMKQQPNPYFDGYLRVELPRMSALGNTERWAAVMSGRNEILDDMPYTEARSRPRTPLPKVAYRDPIEEIVRRTMVGLDRVGHPDKKVEQIAMRRQDREILKKIQSVEYHPDHLLSICGIPVILDETVNPRLAEFRTADGRTVYWMVLD